MTSQTIENVTSDDVEQNSGLEILTKSVVESTQEVQSVASDPNTFQNDNIQTTNQMPSKVTRAPEQTTGRSTKFKCPDCSYSTSKKHTLKVHCAEFCKQRLNAANKDRTCKYCLKQYTRNGLRVHLNQFVRQKRTPKGGHVNVTLLQHKAYLDEIKSSR